MFWSRKEGKLGIKKKRSKAIEVQGSDRCLLAKYRIETVQLLGSCRSFVPIAVLAAVFEIVLQSVGIVFIDDALADVVQLPLLYH